MSETKKAQVTMTEVPACKYCAHTLEKRMELKCLKQGGKVIDPNDSCDQFHDERKWTLPRA